ncbi:hypothetical protein D3C87_1747310 [compost metagenome]
MAQKIGADLQCAGAAQCLRGQYAPGRGQRGIFAQQQRLRTLVVAGDAFNRQIAASGGGFNAGGFGLANGAQQGDPSLIVVVHAHAQVDFTRARIRVELFVQTKNGVARREFDGIEKVAHGLLMRMGGRSTRCCG